MEQKLRASIIKAYKGRCQYCGREGADQIEHIHPQCTGGTDDLLNLTLACQPCNLKKSGDELPEVYKGLLMIEAQRKLSYILQLIQSTPRTPKVKTPKPIPVYEFSYHLGFNKNPTNTNIFNAIFRDIQSNQLDIDNIILDSSWLSQNHYTISDFQNFKADMTIYGKSDGRDCGFAWRSMEFRRNQKSNNITINNDFIKTILLIPSELRSQLLETNKCVSDTYYFK